MVYIQLSSNEGTKYSRLVGVVNQSFEEVQPREFGFSSSGSHMENNDNNKKHNIVAFILGCSHLNLIL